ncbi:nitronate monooxygenase [Halocatena pleomorpha]|uniref:Nitronate monooxygenase n=2 Tax=Halocatena pleomorpha TaxID=1785090 RepID=A0A3P3RJT4_9EURY|nr:nitronate monooxygenase [Halocatena pleomorpha]
MAEITTELTELFGLDVPIVQAPIGSATCPALASAVANAGGVGMLALTWRPHADARACLSETERLTDERGTVGVNLVLDEDATTIPTEEHLDICAEQSVDIVSFSFGDAASHVDRVHEFGAVVMQTVGSAAQARSAVDAGVDIVVAQGWEAGGHVQSEVATLPLVPRVVDAVPKTPVIAAGGIGDGRTVAAVLTLGAAGAWLGTRFVATAEAHVHDRYRERVIDAEETDTVYSTLFDRGWPDVPHRVVENDTVDRWRAAGKPETDRPGGGDHVATTPTGEPIERYADSLAVPETTGNIDELPLYAGQSVGLINDRPTASSVVEALAGETEAALDSAASNTRSSH